MSDLVARLRKLQNGDLTAVYSTVMWAADCIEALEAERDRLGTVIDRWVDKVHALETQVARWESAAASVDAEVDPLDAELSDLHAEAADLRADRDRWRSIADHLAEALACNGPDLTQDPKLRAWWVEEATPALAAYRQASGGRR